MPETLTPKPKESIQVEIYRITDERPGQRAGVF
jgi:hypothetical protein